VAIKNLLVAMRNENFDKGLVVDLRKWRSLDLCNGRRLCLNELLLQGCEHLTNLRNKLCRVGSFLCLSLALTNVNLQIVLSG
jgi:hypothetical protein